MSYCKIILENYNGTYYPGNEIKGVLQCFIHEEITVRGIKVRLICHEHNEWMGYVHHGRKQRRTTLTGDHDILFTEQMLFGSQSGSNLLTVGRHLYEFTYLLPDRIPSTFSGPYGSVSYKILAVVDIPFAFDYEDTFTFKVNSLIDFNTKPWALQGPMAYLDNTSIGCCCCHGGEIIMRAQIPKRAFIPGEVINCKVDISNMSNASVISVKAEFKKIIKFKVTSPKSASKKEVEIIDSVLESGVGAHGEKTYNLKLEIPHHITIPNFSRCELFNVYYKFVLIGVLPFCHMNLDIIIADIEMGHVPWRDRVDPVGLPRPSQATSLPLAPPSEGTSLLRPLSPPSAVSSYPADLGASHPTAPPVFDQSDSPSAPPSTDQSAYRTPPPAFDELEYPSGPPNAPPRRPKQVVNVDDGGEPSAPVDMESPPPTYEEAEQAFNNSNFHPKP